ncbi:MAG: metal-sulfur cluster assembly factor, partial [Porphyromonas endodontalis]
VDIKEDGLVTITMTLTAPNCPAADFILEDVRLKAESVKGVSRCDIELTFEPEWNREMMSEEAKLELGFLYANSCPKVLSLFAHENFHFCLIFSEILS